MERRPRIIVIGHHFRETGVVLFSVTSTPAFDELTRFKFFLISGVPATFHATDNPESLVTDEHFKVNRRAVETTGVLLCAVACATITANRFQTVGRHAAALFSIESGLRVIRSTRNRAQGLGYCTAVETVSQIEVKVPAVGCYPSSKIMCACHVNMLYNGGV
jgi:hypothetical protein